MERELFPRRDGQRPQITSRVTLDCPPEDPWWTDESILVRGKRPSRAQAWEIGKLEDALARVESGIYSKAKFLYFCVEVEDSGKGVSDRPVPYFSEWTMTGYHKYNAYNEDEIPTLEGYWRHSEPVAVFFAAGSFYLYRQHYLLALLKAAGKKAKITWEINMRGVLRATNGKVVGYLAGIKDYVDCEKAPLEDMARAAGLLTTEKATPSYAERTTFRRSSDGPEIPLPKTRAEKTLAKMGLWPIAA